MSNCLCKCHAHNAGITHMCEKCGADLSSGLVVIPDFWISYPLKPPKPPLGNTGLIFIYLTTFWRWICMCVQNLVPIGPQATDDVYTVGRIHTQTHTYSPIDIDSHVNSALFPPFTVLIVPFFQFTALIVPFWRSVHHTFFRYIVISSNSTLPIMKRNRNGISLFFKRKIAFFETENHWPYTWALLASLQYWTWAGHLVCHLQSQSLSVSSCVCRDWSWSCHSCCVCKVKNQKTHCCCSAS